MKRLILCALALVVAFGATAAEPEPIEFAETTIGHTVQAKFQLLP